MDDGAWGYPYQDGEHNMYADDPFNRHDADDVNGVTPHPNETVVDTHLVLDDGTGTPQAYVRRTLVLAPHDPVMVEWRRLGGERV